MFKRRHASALEVRAPLPQRPSHYVLLLLGLELLTRRGTLLHGLGLRRSSPTTVFSLGGTLTLGALGRPLWCLLSEPGCCCVQLLPTLLVASSISCQGRAFNLSAVS